MTLQEVLKSVDDLSVEDQSFLFNRPLAEPFS